ncbi:GNAT family N-acetyltransferase [Clostridium sp.]
MDIEIKELSPKLVYDFINYFDNVAFKDHDDWSACYCIESHLKETKEAELNKLGKQGRRNKAIELIKNNILQGYLAYHDGEVIAWCNAGERKDYEKLGASEQLRNIVNDDMKIKSIVCFNVSPKMRGKGISTMLLKYICQSAKNDGYLYVEGYPRKGSEDSYFHYHGPYELYLKCGFTSYKEFDEISIVRKKL